MPITPIVQNMRLPFDFLYDLFHKTLVSSMYN
jgi:hypothetical protein